MKLCWICGNEAEPPYAKNNRRCYCKSCREAEAKRIAEEKSAYITLKKREMFRSALENLEKQELDMYKFRGAIRKTLKYVEEHPDKFDSSYEMMAAIILIYNGVRCSFQYRVLNYQCDICIPDWNVIIEIDGERHSGRRDEDNVRDKKIIAKLGEDWNIIRIKTELLDMKAENLIKAIQAVMQQRLRDGKAVR